MACYSRCTECGEWVLPVPGMNKQSDKEIVCIDCLHRVIDEQIMEVDEGEVAEGYILTVSIHKKDFL